MAKRQGKDTLRMEKDPVILTSAAVGGAMEGDGPLGREFDRIEQDCYFGEKTFEKAETRMQLTAFETALKKAETPLERVDLLLGGDLLNQCIASGYAMRALERPFFGLYGACSTMAEGLALGALLLEGGAAERLGVVTSSHFCAAERQFRFPLPYGGVRAPSSQHTATAAGAVLMGCGGFGVRVREVTVGRVIDLGVTDLNNMGAAMAPAAWDTLSRYFKDTGTGPEDFDLIVTGDLARVGSDLLVGLAAREGCDLRPRYTDCGLMLYDREAQGVKAGASGCGCSASVMSAHFLPRLLSGELTEMLFLATGALMSPTSSGQGESIPGIAHLVHLSSPAED